MDGRQAGRGGLAGLLAGRPVTRMEWGLERIDRMLEGLGRPERSFRALHFAGTNGKGSAAALAHSVLRAAGYRAALYTSPHLLEPRERIRADGLTPARLDACADRVRPLADAVEATYFEAVTAVAFLAFAETGVAWAAVETGLGGRLDATNLVVPGACGIVSLSHDHEAHLGSSLREIAREKAGILKPGVPVALGELPAEAGRVVEAAAEAVGAPVQRLGREGRVEGVLPDLSGTRFTYRSARRPGGMALRTPLVGAHQAANAGVALLALEAALPELGKEAVRRGLEELRFEGRFQTIEAADGLWVLDVAHNPAALRALRSTLEAVMPPRPIAWVIGILADKPWAKMLPVVRRPGEAAVLTTPPSAPASRRWEPRKALEAWPEAEARPEFERALARGRELADGGTVVVTGSAYTVGDALARLPRSPGEPRE
ncbi:MAG: bifunctional folylpolyglutamate synthase/dihydrofolate synthase [Gemmatimonadota bacterium]